ncbi:MAG: Y-family DNA polymerase [Planctomycetia bacterium]
MSRILTIWLPRWPVQRRLLERPELRRRPVFVCRRERRGVMTVVSWAWAAPPVTGALGRGTPLRIPEGMSLAEAMAVLAACHGSRACQTAEIDHDDPVADRQALEELARSCRRFAPIVALEGPPLHRCRGPECLHVDVTGTADFFGGEAAVVRTAVWTLAARGIHARAAIADTPAAAWAAAHHTDTLTPSASIVAGGSTRGLTPGADSTGRMYRGECRHRRFAIVPPGEQVRMMAGLPATALRLDAAVMVQLRDVGIETIGDVARLPRTGLASRFPPDVSQRLTEFTGERAEPLASSCPDELPAAAQTFDFPLLLRDAVVDDLMVVVERLLQACIAPLAAAGKGVMSLQVRLERSRSADAREACPPLVIDISVFRPSGSARHLAELVRLRLVRLRLPREIEGIAIEVVSAAAAECRQRTLFGAAAESADTQVGLLLDRLAGRLGRGAVFEPRPVADAQPEHAWVAVPPRAGRGRDKGQAPAALRTRHAPQPRPAWLLPRPVRLETVSVLDAAEVDAVNGPPARFRLAAQTHEVVSFQGPERIETAWWRGPMVRRDYYVVETAAGGRYWIFRRLAGAGRSGGAGRGGWFLHGTFA